MTANRRISQDVVLIGICLLIMVCAFFFFISLTVKVLTAEKNIQKLSDSYSIPYMNQYIQYVSGDGDYPASRISAPDADIKANVYIWMGENPIKAKMLRSLSTNINMAAQSIMLLLITVVFIYSSYLYERNLYEILQDYGISIFAAMAASMIIVTAAISSLFKMTLGINGSVAIIKIISFVYILPLIAAVVCFVVGRIKAGAKF